MPKNNVFENFYGMIKDTFVKECLRDQKKNDSKKSPPTVSVDDSWISKVC